MASPIAVLFANLKGNIGDLAILHAMLRDMERVFSNSPVHVFRNGCVPVDEDRLMAFQRSSGLAFEMRGKTYSRAVGQMPLVRAARVLGFWPLIQERLVSSLAAQCASRAAVFKEYDAVFIVGGGNWNGAKLGVSMFATVEAVRRHNDRIYSYPFSVDARIRDYNLSRAIRRNFAKIQPPLIVRDGISMKVLDGLGIESVLGADAVFSLQDLADAILPASERDRSRILFALTGGKAQVLKSALERIRAKGYAVALLTTCEFEDGWQCETVLRELDVPYCAPTTWQEAVAEIKSSRLLVSNRLHGLIFGTLAGTPLLPVTNRQKTRAFAEDAGMPHRAPAVGALTPELIERCLADGDVILERMKSYRARATAAVRSPIGNIPAA